MDDAFSFGNERGFERERAARGRPLSPAYLDAQRIYLRKHVLPFFGEKRLAKNTPAHVERWLLPFENPASANRYLSSLKVMLGEARQLGVIRHNPAREIPKLAEKPKEKSILTLEEVQALFEDAETTWNGNMKFYAANLLSASTGMRLGEVQSLKCQYIYNEHVSVMHNWGRKHGPLPPKGGIPCDVPIPAKASSYLQRLVSEHRDDEAFVFCLDDDPYRPIDHKTHAEALYDALAAIEIDEKQREARNITFHSWQHWFNTVCRSRVPDYKLRVLTGHRTEKMTDHYTHIRLEDFSDVAELQEEVFG